jgi:hypothetical protein
MGRFDEWDDSNTFAIEVQSVVAQMMRQVRDQQEAQIKAVLREAFEAGRDRGVADQGDAYWGPPYDDTPEFEEWLAQKIAEVAR